MEYVIVKISGMKKLSEFIRLKINRSFKQSIDNDVLLKPVKLFNKIIENIHEINSKHELLLNDIYSQIKKFYSYIKDYNSSTISKEKRFEDLKKSSNRISIYLETLYPNYIKEKSNILRELNEYWSNIFNFKDSNDVNDQLEFKLKLINFQKMPYCEEYVMFNIVHHQEGTYFYKVNDTIFKFFYFYKSEDDTWFWSPPRKTDLNDVWMECPKYKVEEGYWKGWTIPKYVEEFVVWLSLLKPIIEIKINYKHIK